MSRIKRDGYDEIEAMWPDESAEWREAWLARVRWYLAHSGDMTGAPALPGEGG